MRMRITISDMKHVAEIAQIETRVREAGHTLSDLFREANVNASQWVRWKQQQIPRLDTWTRIQDAADKLAPMEASE